MFRRSIRRPKPPRGDGLYSEASRRWRRRRAAGSTFTSDCPRDLCGRTAQCGASFLASRTPPSPLTILPHLRRLGQRIDSFPTRRGSSPDSAPSTCPAPHAGPPRGISPSPASRTQHPRAQLLQGQESEVRATANRRRLGRLRSEIRGAPALFARDPGRFRLFRTQGPADPCGQAGPSDLSATLSWLSAYQMMGHLGHSWCGTSRPAR